MNIALAVAMLCQIHTNVNIPAFDFYNYERLSTIQLSCQKYYASCMGEFKSTTMGDLDQKILNCISKK